MTVEQLERMNYIKDEISRIDSIFERDDSVNGWRGFVQLFAIKLMPVSIIWKRAGQREIRLLKEDVIAIGQYFEAKRERLLKEFDSFGGNNG